MRDEQNKHEALDAFISELCARGLKYNAIFLPQSQSRNEGDKNRSLNWIVTLDSSQRGAQPYRTDYMQGIGHVPQRDAFMKSARLRSGVVDQYELRNYEYTASQEGTYRAAVRAMPKRIPPPKLRDVLYCLVSDARGVDSQAFEDWAQEYGYDSDSRKAEAIYNACRETHYALTRLLGRQVVEKLAELFQDY